MVFHVLHGEGIWRRKCGKGSFCMVDEGNKKGLVSVTINDVKNGRVLC